MIEHQHSEDDLENNKFFSWEHKWRTALETGYGEYLKNTVLDDENFDIKETEDYWTWCEEEYLDEKKEIRLRRE